MALLLLRYGEIALKGKNRGYFLQRLQHNVRSCLHENGIQGQVRLEGRRVYVETDQAREAAEALCRVFGIVSLSRVDMVPAEMQAIAHQAVATARKAGLNSQRSFRVRARRSDKSFPYGSPQIQQVAGAAVVDATGAKVDLSRQAEIEIGIEVHAEYALVFGETIPGPGGLPLGSQGRVVALLSSGIDSPVAIWLMMKRGCSVIPVHFYVNSDQISQVQAIIEALSRYAYGWHLKPILLSHEEALTPTLERLRDLRAERWACLFCKRTMLATAVQIAERLGAAAVVTGDSLGQVASQTLDNLEVSSAGIQKPILRPLIGLDKIEITALAQKIGTYQASTQSASPCPFLPERPLTQASRGKLRQLLAAMEAGSVPGPDGRPSNDD